MKSFWLVFLVLFLGSCAPYKVLRNPVSGDLATCDSGYIHGLLSRQAWVNDCVSQWEALGYVRVEDGRLK